MLMPCVGVVATYKKKCDAVVGNNCQVFVMMTRSSLESDGVDTSGEPTGAGMPGK